MFCFGCDPDDDNSMLTYSCVNDDCFAEEDGQYATLQDCLSVCVINSSDINSIYTGNWNFKGNGISYSGYYVYDSLLNSEWVANVTYTTDYNDSTGSIQLGENVDELIFKYCEICEPIIYNLNDSGFVYSEYVGGNTGWTLTDTTFFNIVIPPPPSYSPSYSTYNIEGWKLQ